MGGFKNTSIVLFAVAALTAACSSEPTPQSNPTPTQQSSKPEATSAGRLGGADTPCKLPVSFELAAKWKPKPIENMDDLGSLVKQGGFNAVCEIDAKPAGIIGFLRIWTSTKTSPPRQALDDYLADDKNITVPEYSEVKVASTTATEVSYVRDNPTAEVKKRERILSVPTPSGAVLITVGGFDDDEHAAMLPAYELAKKSLTIP
ncbi:lipoprotein [Kibdelosporangium philippinense]|uniref:Lipoprotein n=1 Tax=Kibdelosporangium philippinense TaxID=211113 RepID=A0ABS8ZT54_9PSEU|nr:lipoprotein [Kibdelosporangium philippinense]MCE7010862.1 lipoprotein [Kibdelosporangium philippinense]